MRRVLASQSTLVTILFVIIAFTTAFTPAWSREFVSFSYGRGGDRLADITGGQNYQARAGSGLAILGGWWLPISPTRPHSFEGQLGFGYLFQEDAGPDRNSVSWSRIPIEASYHYHNHQEKFRLGWGVTYHVANRLEGKGLNSSITTNIGNALGWMASAEKIWLTEDDGEFAFGIRYTTIRYRLIVFDQSVDANTWSFTFSGFRF
ncbi:MAG: hypothetical protein JNL11_05735 [Bdellovibrionaceae bacterium]|nr:hypothetical protein [Pseudobdellovibrionaceae bacterium]